MGDCADLIGPLLAGHPERLYLEQLLRDLDSGNIDVRIDAISDAIRKGATTLATDVAGYF